MTKSNKINYTVPLMAMVAVFFMFGGFTAMNSNVLTPYAKDAFGLSSSQTGLVNFAFFIAYFVFSIPASTIVKKIGYKKSVVVGLVIMCVGSLLYLGSVKAESSIIFMIATFIVASGITILQVACNPYLAKLGSPDGASMRITIAGALNSSATYIGPYFGGAYILNAAMKGEALTLVYTLLTILVALVAVTIFFSKLPEIEDEEEEGEVEGNSPFKHRQLTFGVIGIFAYVGAEVGVATYIGEYLSSKEIGLTAAQGAKISANYWLMAMIGRFAGAPLLKFVSSQKALLIAAAVNIALIALAIMTPNDNVVGLGDFVAGIIGADTLPLAVIYLIIVGLFNSVMWGCIFSLAVDGLGSQTSKASGYLMMAVVGGAVMPLLQGFVSDGVGVKVGFLVAAACYAYLAFYAINGWKKSKSAV